MRAIVSHGLARLRASFDGIPNASLGRLRGWRRRHAHAAVLPRRSTARGGVIVIAFRSIWRDHAERSVADLLGDGDAGSGDEKECRHQQKSHETPWG